MVKRISSWFENRFSNTDLLVLLFSIAVIIAIFMTAGKLLAPIITSIIFAYLLDGLVKRLESWGVSRTVGIGLVCLLSFGIILLAVLVLLPLLWKQLSNLFNEVPAMVKHGSQLFDRFSQRYPDIISKEQAQDLLAGYQADMTRFGKVVLSYSLTTISSFMTIIVYLVLVPLIVFFLLKDKTRILNWSERFLPKRRRLLIEVWEEVHLQMGNYVRGKALEMLIVGVIATIMFALLGLNYSVLLGVLVGISSLIPFVGAIVVTIPVVIIALLQWGLSAHFVYLLIAYTILMTLDGNILTPLLFSETMELHPLAIIIAILFFGELWGFWGVFFAIPLATVVKAVLNAWFANQPKN